METMIVYQDGKFAIGSKPIRCGKRLELFINNRWLSGRIRFKSGYCFYNDEIGDIRLEDGMKVKISSLNNDI